MADPILLTPGPLTTTARTKAAMLTDWGSWDSAFNELTASICRDLLKIVHAAADTHVCVPLQGSGTFSVEAALGTLVPKGGKVLVPDNGAYCKRITRILGYLGREAVVMPFAEDEPADPARIDAVLASDPGITHVARVHCGHTQSTARDCRCRHSPRPQAHHRCDEFLWRHSHRRSESAVRGAGG